MNRKFAFVFLSLFFVLQVGLQAGQSWYEFQKGIEIAEGGQKHLVIDFYADWCHWCKVMDEKTFSDSEVEEYLFEKFVPIKLNAESTTETITFLGQEMTPRELTSAFRVTGFPSLAFLTPNFEVITVIPGYIKKDQFIKILEYMDHECYKSEISFEEFLKNGCDNRSSK